MRREGFDHTGSLFRRGIAAVATLALIAVGVPGTSFAQVAGEPSIAFLNPSSFATGGERGIVVSDAAPEEGPGCCEGTGPGYHLSAWVGNAPPGSRVFFSVTQNSADIEITDTQPSDESTWDSNWRIPAEIVDGPATFYAYLVLDDVPIAVAEQRVTILRLQENTQIKYPQAGGSFGTYAPLADALVEGEAATRTPPAGVVDALYTLGPDATRVRAFYSTSAPGTVPQWKVCGTELVGTGTTRAGNGVRCTVDPADAQDAVTAVAAVTNDGPEDAPYDSRFNQSGDGVAVSDGYAQQPTRIGFLTGGNQRRDRNANTSAFPCSTAEIVKVTDQLDRHVAGANVDVHAVGPSDTLKFNADSLSIWTDVKAPDRATHTSEAAYDCFTHPANSDPGKQGEHPRFGAPDRKHIESHNPGTTDLGTFVFQMRATVEGVTEYTVWVDEADDGCAANDDTFTDGEIAVSGLIGWGQDAFGGTEQPREPMTACTAGTPEPTESPTTEPTDPPAIDQRLTIRAIVDKKARGPREVRFKGLLASSVEVCAQNRPIVLKSRKIGGTFIPKQTGATKETGRWAMVRTVERTREWRVVAKPAGECPRVKSPILRVRISQR
ncbi:MAG TPA: hypothetical protein VG929_06360 [Actinomycetota bacterium]|nr:hypothetical protein [Actinomycetota bacterium]